MASDRTLTLVSRLAHLLREREKPLCILLGAGATQPVVPSVPELTSEAHAFVERCASLDLRASLDQFLSSPQSPLPVQANKVAEYSEALHAIQEVRGQAGVLAFVQAAVLRAYHGSSARQIEDARPLSYEQFRRCEDDVENWQLPYGLQSLAAIIAESRSAIKDPILTTNFDPLIEIALRRAGLRAATVSPETDAPPIGYRKQVNESMVIHLHGDCYGRTLHTPWSISSPRPHLERWLGELIVNANLLVVGYSGWDDLIHRAIQEQLRSMPGLEILWSVYEDRSTHKVINPNLERFFVENSTIVTPYYGIDRDSLFGYLHEAVQHPATVKSIGPTVRESASDVYSLARELNSSYHFGIYRIRPSSTTRVAFWPHKLREVHLIHGVHALAAVKLSKLNVSIELHLDDVGLEENYGDRLYSEFVDAVFGWFEACAAPVRPVVTRTSVLLSAGPPDTTQAKLWQLAADLFSSSNTAFDALLAAKAVDPDGEALVARQSPAHSILRPAYTWFALEDVLSRYDLSTAEPGSIVTLGGEDEQRMWELWHRRRNSAAVAHFFVPRLSILPSGSDPWTQTNLWREAPFGPLELEKFVIRMAQSGTHGESALEWLFTSAARLAESASGGAKGKVAFMGAGLHTGGEALDALRREPVEASRSLARAISGWFHPYG